MSLTANLRALPSVCRVGFAEAVAYRAEMLIWILSTSMPLVMLVLWNAVARDAPVGRFGQIELTAYFLTTFCVRQLTASWIGWQVNFEVREGTLSMRLLRPIPPVVCYAVEHLAALPLRLLVVIPVAAIAVLVAGREVWPEGLLSWSLVAVALVGGWLINFVGQFCIGSLAFFLQSSVKVIDLWYVTFMVLSGYMFPLELLPDGVRHWVDVLPFRFQLGLPVELANGLVAGGEALRMVGVQWLWVAALSVLAALLWRRGLARFAAFGG